jgi:hypothetical protein
MAENFRNSPIMIPDNPHDLAIRTWIRLLSDVRKKPPVILLETVEIEIIKDISVQDEPSV